MGVFYALAGAFFALCLVGIAFFAGVIGAKCVMGASMIPAGKGEEDDEEQRSMQKLQKQWDSLFSYTGRKGGEDE